MKESMYVKAIAELTASRGLLVLFVKHGTLQNNTKQWEMLYKLMHYIRICIRQRRLIVDHDIKNQLYDQRKLKNYHVKRSVIFEELLFNVIKAIMFASSYNSNRSKDKALMIVHHAITAALILIGDRFNILNGVIYILYIHNVSDAVLGLSRLGCKLTTNPAIEIALIVATLVSWVYFRLYVLGKQIVYDETLSLKMRKTLGKKMQRISATFFIMLVCMHTFWLYSMIKIVVKKFRQNLSLQDSPEV